MSRNSDLPETDYLMLCRRPVAADVLLRARVTLLDWLGCIIAARHTDVARAMGRTCRCHDGDVLRAGLVSTGVDAQQAALLLGTLGNVLEMDDLHRASILHPGDTVGAATLAVGLRQDVTGAAMLAALTRGYEAAIRIGRVAASGGYTTFYNSGTCGVFGAALAAADLMAPAETVAETVMADALGQAGMMAAGIWQCRLEPTFSKQLATAHAARAGVFAAELAATGFPGARAILTGPMGFFASFYPGGDRTHLAAPGDWALLEMSFKPFAACRHTHPAISAALDLRGSDSPALPERVDVQTYRAAIDFCDAPVPTTPDQARFSLQHAVAVALSRGAPAIADFEADALSAPDIAALRARVRLQVDPGLDAAFPQSYGARVRLTDGDGSQRETVCPAAWGDPENPMSETVLIDKFRANAAYGRLTPAQADAILQAVMVLPEAPDLSVLKIAFAAAFAPDLE